MMFILWHDFGEKENKVPSELAELAAHLLGVLIIYATCIYQLKVKKIEINDIMV
jgi:hypothetical protein